MECKHNIIKMRLALVALLFFGLSGYLMAQTTRAKPKEEPLSPPAPSMYELRAGNLITRDGAEIAANYYEGGRTQETVPVILLHGQYRSKSDFQPMIEEFKKREFAVMAVDLRGHGDSAYRRTFEEPDRQDIVISMPTAPNKPMRDSTGRKVEGPKTIYGPVNPPDYDSIVEYGGNSEPEEKRVPYKYESFVQDDWVAILNEDLIPVMNYLRVKNNEKFLNLNKLCIVGVDMGATVGLFWASDDWKVRNGGSHSPTRTTKTLVMISPRDEKPLIDIFKGNKTMRDNVSFLTIVGQLSPSKVASAKNLRDAYFGKIEEPEGLGLESKFPILAVQSEKQGQDLLTDPKASVSAEIANFIEKRLENRKDSEIKWKRL